jgi:integrase/recombinase XerD
MRLDRALDRFDGDMARRNCSRRSRDDYYRTLCRLFLFVPRDPVVVDVTPDALRECLDTWAKRKPNTRYKVDAIFRKFCGWLVEQELLDRDPMQRIPRPVKQHPEDIEVVSLSEAGVMRMFEACETPRELVCLSVVAYLGPRRGAASRLRVRDLDLENGHMRFFEKGGKVIWKPMPDELAALVAEAIEAGIIGSQPDDYVIPMAGKQRRKGDRDDRAVYYIVKTIAKRAAVEAHVHALRAAFAVKYLESNPGRLLELKELMGHRNLATTQIYLRRLDRQRSMETVRPLSWGARFSAIEDKATSGFEPLYEALQASA